MNNSSNNVNPTSSTANVGGGLGELQIRQLMQHSPDCVEILDLMGNMLWMNATGHRLMAPASHETRAASLWLELWPNADYVTSRTAFSNAIDKGVGQFTAKQFSDEHGEKIWDISVSALLDQKGEPDKILSIARDITATGTIESPPEQSRVAYRTFFENSSDGAFQIDANGAALTVNPALSKMLGWQTPEDLISECPDFVFETIPDPIRRIELQTLLNTCGRANAFKYRLTRRDNTHIQVALTIWAIRDEGNGVLLGYEGYLQNETFLRNAERLIREQSHFINQAHDAIMVLSPEKRITFWNKSAERSLGWSNQEVLGRKTSELSCFDQADFGAICKSLNAGGEWRGEFNAINKAGQNVVFDAHFTPITNEAGDHTSCLCIASDVTEKRQFEDRALHSQRLEGIGMLAAGIAHDLNNVLAPILMAVPMLSDHVKPAPARQLLDMMEKSAERGAGLVRQILTFANQSKGQAAAMDITPIIKDLSSVIQETFPKSINYETSIAPGLWMIKSNPVQLHQVLLNLCVNARDAMHDDGNLTLTAVNQKLPQEEARKIKGGISGDYVLLSITDNGPGISPEVVAKIWEPFFSTKLPGKGTGLGLSTVKGIVEKHGGFVGLDSIVGQGSTFHVWLPVDKQPTEDPKKPPVLFKDSPQDSGLVLVVDDEPGIREMTKTAFVKNGYRVHTASDGVEAVQFFTQNSQETSLVITDLCMPNLDGWAMVQSIRQLAPETKFIIMSGGQGEIPNQEELKESNAMFIRKPFAINVLLEEAERLLASE